MRDLGNSLLVVEHDEDTIFGTPAYTNGTNFKSIVKDKIFLCNNRKDIIEKRIHTDASGIKMISSP